MCQERGSNSGPFGCLGSGPGYALAAKLARPDRQVVLLQGDGAFGFSGMEWDTLTRHGVHVVSVIGNNGIWALEKHPMEMLYGYSVVAELRPGTRYDEVVSALGGHGELVSTPAEVRPHWSGHFVRCARGGQRTDRPRRCLPPPLQPRIVFLRERACLHTTRRGSNKRARSRPSRPEIAGLVRLWRRSWSRENQTARHGGRVCAIAEPLYRRDPVVHTIELTLLAADNFADDAFLMTVWNDGTAVGAALQTPPYPLACNGIPVADSAQ